MVVSRIATCLAALLLLGGASFARAQAPAGTGRVTVVPQADYSAGAFHRMLFGNDYRRLWATPLQVEQLDLATYAGGLTPLQRGGGQQTRSLRFATADGRQVQFRSVDKDPSPILPPDLLETLVADLVQDQISAAHPVGALVVSPILEAVGVLHAEPRLVVLPDDARLGEFQEEFGGMLGILEERPDENDTELAAFHGASNVVGTPRMLEGLEENAELVDSRAFLAARLVDLFLGDWDRHADQWRWARFGDDRNDRWQPIPRDRDQAFARYDGLLFRLGRVYYPQFVSYDEEYPSILGLTWNGRDLDRRILVDLDRPVFDSVATALRAQLTDAVIDEALGRLPPELAPLGSEDLRRRMRARRDALTDVADRFYDLLVSEVEVHTTDAAEVVDIERLSGTQLRVTVTARETPYGAVTVFQRTFDRTDTKEVRLFLHGGADSVRIRGVGEGVGLRIVGGGGADVLVDEAGGSHFYDTDDDTEFVRGPGTSVDTRDFQPPAVTPSPLNRDWGSWTRFPLRAAFAPDIGLIAGLTAERFDFGFRKVPWSSSLRVGGAWGTRAEAYQVDAELTLHRENSRFHGLVRGEGTGLDIVRFHGFGNETVLDRPQRDYRVEQRLFRLEQQFVIPVSEAVSLALGPRMEYAKTDRPPTLLDGLPLPYGMGEFGQLGFSADLDIEGRDRVRASTSGAHLQLRGRVYPSVWDVQETFGQVSAVASTYLTPLAPQQPTLAIRIGGSKNLGAYPFHEAAYLGDAETVRLGTEQRYAGDAMAYANAELRLRLGRMSIVLPADIGVFGLYDVGRVWLDGESSDQWHTAVGGGLWLAFLRPENAFTVALANSDERLGVYVGAGFAF